MKTKLLMFMLLSAIAINTAPKITIGDKILCLIYAIGGILCAIGFIIDVLWDIFKKKEE
jgi:hypothetical protein